MKIHDVEQGSEEWLTLRKGRPTASEFAKIVTPKTGKLSTGRNAYMARLVGECFVPGFDDFRGNEATDWGNMHEPIARDAFRDHTGLNAVEAGFITRDDGVVGCSPDGLVLNADGEPVSGLEIKCPWSPFKFVEYFTSRQIPDIYKVQVHGSMAVTGLKKWRFWMWYPGMEPMLILQEWDDFTDKVESALDEFLAEYKAYRDEWVPRLSMNDKALPQAGRPKNDEN